MITDENGCESIIDENGERIYQWTGKPFFKTPFNHNTELESERTALTCNDPTRTQQNFIEDADINTIVGRFLKTGVLPPVRQPPSYADFMEVTDFQSAMNAINHAKESFMQLPAEVRNTFNNDPGQFIHYVDHCIETGDFEPLQKMGLGVPQPPVDLPEVAPGTTPQPPPEPPKGA